MNTPQLERVRALMDEQFAEPWSLDDLTRQAHLSRYHFIRLFQRHFYETPHQYLTRKRLEHLTQHPPEQGGK